MLTEDPDIRQIVIRFGASGYIIRYAILHETSDVLITRNLAWSRSTSEPAPDQSFRATAVSLVMFCSNIRPRCRSRMPSLRQSCS